MNNPLFKLIMHIAGYDLIKAGKKIEALQKLSIKEKLKWQDAQKWKMARHHYKYNQNYKDKVGGNFPVKWEDLPIMEKNDYQQPIENLISKNYLKSKLYISNTSGSSGHPFFFAKNKEAHSLTWAYIQKRYKDLGIGDYELEARFYGIPLEKKGYFKEILKDWIANRIRFPVFDLSDEVFAKFIILFKKKNFTYIYGYTNSIVLFSRYVIREGINFFDICPSLKKIIVTSEICTNEDRQIIKKAFGLPILSEYGASEFGYIGFQKSSNIWQVADDLVYVENDSHQNLLITDLHNKAFPFIRYRIGDIGKLFHNDSGNQYIENLQGRTNDSIILPSGKIAPGLTFYYISRSILEKSSVLKEFIIKQIEKDFFIFEVVSFKPIDDTLLLELQDNVDKYLEPGIRIKINRVDSISRPNSGKIKHFYSLINQ
ncbi:MAG: AMP-binding protein [Candidatus Marinimicrobia bacterium]|nr:AMP-binding protein [Candidatus Neomarinimicrobiota bacterium]